jgi:hypothetical protein
MVREDKVDILVELTGHTANNKLGMMACRPAPVQVCLRLFFFFFFGKEFIYFCVGVHFLMLCF